LVNKKWPNLLFSFNTNEGNSETTIWHGLFLPNKNILTKKKNMKNAVSMYLLYSILANTANAQNVGIGITTPHVNAQLEVRGINKGILIPAGDANTRNPGLKDNTAKGLIMYDTLRGTLWVHNGNGMPTGWKEIQDDATGLWVKNGLDISSNNLPNGNVAIGLANTLSRLQVNGNATTNPVIKSLVAYAGGSDVRAVEGTSLPAPGYGIGGYFEGGYIGLKAQGNPQTLSSGTVYGIQSAITNTGQSLTRHGVNSVVSGPGNNYGVYASAGGGTANYSFYGNDGNAYFPDSIWLLRSPGLARFDMLGTRGDVDVSEGDFRIGNTTQRLKMGVFTTGTFAGLARIYAAGTNARLVFGTNSMDIMGISPTNGGQVIIGNGAGATTAASGYKLNVHGKIVCTEVMVKDIASWPDYVFSPSYNLMPLQLVRKYIEENKHLPNLESAATVEKEGLQLAGMQKKLVEKIEELTLYILQQDEKLRSQQDEINAIKKLIAK